MTIVVLVKQVPDSGAERTLSAVDYTLPASPTVSMSWASGDRHPRAVEHISLLTGFCWIVAVGFYPLRRHVPGNTSTPSGTKGS